MRRSWLGHLSGRIGAVCCIAWVLSCLPARATEPVDLAVTAQGTEAQLLSLEQALVQQFAGEPVHLLLWGERGPAITMEKVQAELEFRPGGALLKVTLADQSKRNEFVQGGEPQMLARTIAIIISHVLLRAEAERVSPGSTGAVRFEREIFEPGEERVGAEPRQASRSRENPDDPEQADPEQADPEQADPEQADPEQADPDQSATKEVDQSPGEAQETVYAQPESEAASQQLDRPLHPWVSLTGFGVSAILIGPAIISASASQPPDQPPSGFVRTADETEALDRVRLRTRGQNRLTAALVTTSVVAGAAGIVLATAFTDWNGADRSSGVSLLAQPGGMGCQIFGEF